MTREVTERNLWIYVWLLRLHRGLAMQDVAREARLKPETLVRFETEGGTEAALVRVKYAIDRLSRSDGRSRTP